MPEITLSGEARQSPLWDYTKGTQVRYQRLIHERLMIATPQGQASHGALLTLALLAFRPLCLYSAHQVIDRRRAVTGNKPMIVRLTKGYAMQSLIDLYNLVPI